MHTANPNDNELIPLNQAIRREVPGERNPGTVHRWITRGLEGLDGKRIRLSVTYCGRQPCTTRAAVRQFLDEVTKARLARIERTQQRAVDVTNAELSEVGLLTTKRR